MFEISIFLVIVLAVGYWLALWLMGRHDDVLHGDFVHVETAPEAVSVSSPASRTDSTETLESLLTSIKRDLKDAAQI
jgi:hypothetical protein